MLALKNRVALNSLYWIYFLHSGFLSNLRLPWKTVCPKMFLCIEYAFYHSGFLSNLCLLWKTVALKFFTVLNICFTVRIFEQLAFALKRFTLLKYFLSFRIFEQLALALKTEFTLKIFKPVGAAAQPDPPPRTPMVIHPNVPKLK